MTDLKTTPAHTAGPWKLAHPVTAGMNHVEIITEDDADGYHLAVAMVYETSIKKGEPDRLEKDARLIAATTDLLEACEYINTEIGHRMPPACLKVLQAAIAKATLTA